MIDITGIDKAKLLMALHQNSKAQGISFLHEREVSLIDCQKRLELTGDIDYFAGRVIKCDLSSDQLDGRMYDRDNGDGVAERVVNSIR
jgi:hypothetical protein